MTPKPQSLVERMARVMVEVCCQTGEPNPENFGRGYDVDAREFLGCAQAALNCVLKELREPSEELIEAWWKAKRNKTHADEGLAAFQCVADAIASYIAGDG